MYHRFVSKPLIHGIAATVLGLFVLVDPASATPDPQAARQKLEDIAETMVTSLQDPAVRESVPRLQQLVVEVLVPHIDFRVSSNLVLGPHWKDASEAQRDAFIREFQAFLVRFYTGALASYVDSTDIPLDIMSFDQEPVTKGTNQALVRSRVGQVSGDPVAVDYRMYWSDDWKVIDVSVAGISMVQNYRSNFTSTVKQQGLDSLIAQLHERNQSFAAN